MNFKIESHGYWTAGKGKNMRAFLEGFAKKMNLDPLLPSTWYLLSRGDIKKAKVWRGTGERGEAEDGEKEVIRERERRARNGVMFWLPFAPSALFNILLLYRVGQRW